MATIKEDYCPQEICRLIREKGFDGEIHTTFDKEGYTQVSITLQMAMKWLREVHKMYVCIDIKSFMPHLGEIDGYSARIWYKPENNAGICCYWVYPPKQQEAWDTYEAATEAAIKYCLENLI